MNLYNKINETPADYTAANTLARFVDSFGFRYRFSTEGLTENDIINLIYEEDLYSNGL